ncbi:hypothetical protein MMC28_010155 [Mycoblastus sanguinarius]|nr:hypothetical protein [Mycoblastus sanguinarius]
MPADQRCGDPGTNQLDIDQTAYMALTGQAFGSGPSLNVAIAPSCCPGDSGCSTGSSAESSATQDPAAQSPNTQAAPVLSSPAALSGGLGTPVGTETDAKAGLKIVGAKQEEQVVAVPQITTSSSPPPPAISSVPLPATSSVSWNATLGAEEALAVRVGLQQAAKIA